LTISTTLILQTRAQVLRICENKAKKVVTMYNDIIMYVALTKSFPDRYCIKQIKSQILIC